MVNKPDLQTQLRIAILMLCMCLLRLGVNAQDDTRYFSFELAGSGGFGSFNYEHSIIQKPRATFNMRYGLSFAPIDKNNGNNIVFPVMLHCLLGKESHKLDLAAGQALSITTKGSFFMSAPLAVGYRYQPVGKRHFFRVSYTPLVSYIVDFQWQHWAGITYGIKLKSKS